MRVLIFVRCTLLRQVIVFESPVKRLIRVACTDFLSIKLFRSNMAKKNVLDALLDVLTSNASSEIVGPIKQPVQKSNLSDKIPSAHSDFIISMILSNSNELFSDNRKRKPIFNARRKQKWTELVQQLNQSLNVDYSVERVKNNFHYRITSLKRNLSRITGYAVS